MMNFLRKYGVSIFGAVLILASAGLIEFWMGRLSLAVNNEMVS